MFKFTISDSLYNEVVANLFNKLTAIINSTEITMENQTIHTQQPQGTTQAPAPTEPISLSWDDINEGGGGVLLPEGMYPTTLVGVVWGMGLDDYDKAKEPRPFKGMKCIFATIMPDGKTEYISTGRYYLEMSLTPKGFLTKIMQPLTNSVSVDLKTIRTQSMVEWFRAQLGCQLTLQVGQKGADKKFNIITGYARSTTVNPATNQLEVLPANMNVPNLNIPKMFFTDAIDFVVLPSQAPVAAQVQQQQQPAAIAQGQSVAASASDVVVAGVVNTQEFAAQQMQQQPIATQQPVQAQQQYQQPIAQAAAPVQMQAPQGTIQPIQPVSPVQQ